MSTKSISWNTGNGTITLTYQGQGDGTITVASDQNDLATARSQTITIKTTKGGLKTKNLTITQGACPVPVGTVLNYAYTGSYQEVTLPAGRYKLQCWGAQGGSNAADSSYSITANAGGKGGYSEGVITLTAVTKVRVYVGGAGSSSAGGFNGGGSTTGSATYNSDNEQGVSCMGGGGGATDIRLSDAALLSRMIVAGGGSGGAMCYKRKTNTEYVSIATCSHSKWKTITTFNSDNADAHIYISSHSGYGYAFKNVESLFSNGKTYRIIYESGTVPKEVYIDYINGGSWRATLTVSTSSSFTFNSSYISNWNWLQFCFIYNSESEAGVLRLEEKESNDSVTVGWIDNKWGPSQIYANQWYVNWSDLAALGVSAGDTIRVVTNPAPISTTRIGVVNSSWGNIDRKDYYARSTCDYTIPNNSNIAIFLIQIFEARDTGSYSGTIEIKVLRTSATEERTSQVGYVGGGTNGGGYSSSYYGKQNGAGNDGTFGQGANQTTTDYRYCSGAGGGGWYGGGMNYSDSDMNACKMSGGGSGFVNTAASAGNRPSGYTGLQLDSGTTYAGNQSFPNTAGSGNETGHSGNGYAKITRLK